MGSDSSSWSLAGRSRRLDFFFLSFFSVDKKGG
jgi:hypothetical protein